MTMHLSTEWVLKKRAQLGTLNSLGLDRSLAGSMPSITRQRGGYGSIIWEEEEPAEPLEKLKWELSPAPKAVSMRRLFGESSSSPQPTPNWGGMLSLPKMLESELETEKALSSWATLTYLPQGSFPQTLVGTLSHSLWGSGTSQIYSGQWSGQAGQMIQYNPNLSSQFAAQQAQVAQQVVYANAGAILQNGYITPQAGYYHVSATLHGGGGAGGTSWSQQLGPSKLSQSALGSYTSPVPVASSGWKRKCSWIATCARTAWTTALGTLSRWRSVIKNYVR